MHQCHSRYFCSFYHKAVLAMKMNIFLGFPFITLHGAYYFIICILIYLNTVNPLYTDIHYNDKTRYNDECNQSLAQDGTD